MAQVMTSRVLGRLLEDHRMIESTFTRWEATADEAAREEPVSQMVRALAVHALVEEQLVYPLLPRAFPTDGTRRWDQALAEQQVQKELLARIDRADPSAERASLVTDLIAATRPHIAEEERDLFPGLEAALGAASIDRMWPVFQAARLLSPSHPHPKAPNRPPWNVVAGLAVAPVDRGRDLLGPLVRSALKPLGVGG